MRVTQHACMHVVPEASSIYCCCNACTLRQNDAIEGQLLPVNSETGVLHSHLHFQR